MPKLRPEMQTFVVQSVACFEEPSAVAAAVKERFGIEITRQAVEADQVRWSWAGGQVEGGVLATRKAFLEDTARIGISHRAVRLRALQRLANRAEEEGDLDLVLKVLDQAAREMADVYARRQNGGTPADDPAVEARRKELLERLKNLVDRAKGNAA